MSFFSEFKTKSNHAGLKEREYNFLFEKDKSEEFIVFDTQTTGYNIRKDDILSIGAVKIKGNRVITSHTFEAVINEEKTIDEAVKDFLYFIGSRPLIGFYLEFDVAMINKYIKKKIGIVLPNKMIEVSEIYYNKTIKSIPQGNIDLRFDTILGRCGIPYMGAHNAVNDAIMMAMIYLKLTKER
ncbi:ribonuclease H-like domain-containing protein [Sulfurimonas sp.]|uniref:ribonuclease H-like domain-containing protein n=1 Tax=Sulfurimonas sp. TaxID=2022749 RepID=UPI002AB31B6E|nr:ribonuclease H-like domain-containing protein [Sulfurimonas sp.]